MRGAGTVATMVALALVGSAACRIATVRPLGESGEPAGAEGPASGPFDAAAFVDSIWRSEVLRSLDEAQDVAAMTGGPSGTGPRAVAVRGSGRVLSVNTRSRSGTAIVQLDGKAGTNVVLQVGPVITGTAIRDALPALGFDRFANQIQHADVGNELNARVEREVLGPLDTAGLRGRHVRFTGMATFEEGRPPVVTPVRLEVDKP